MDTEQQRIEAFIKELTELSNRHGIIIMTEYAEKPWLEFESERGKYTYNQRSAGLEWEIC